VVDILVQNSATKVLVAPAERQSSKKSLVIVVVPYCTLPFHVEQALLHAAMIVNDPRPAAIRKRLTIAIQTMKDARNALS
jgi:hypothetical protein